MKRLTLLRHAKSGEDAGHARDFDRRLNAKGRRAARTVGRHMRDQGLRFDAVVASPAVRVEETLEEVRAGYGAPLDPRWERRIYMASVEDLLDVIRETPAETSNLLLVGHNPGLEQLVLLLTPDCDHGARDQVEEKYPTASLAELTFAVDRWADIGEGGGSLVRFIRPRDLDPELGPDAA